MSEINEAVIAARRCTETNWKTESINRLVAATDRLDGQGRRRLRKEIGAQRKDFDAAMARQALISAPCSASKAEIIIAAMIGIYGRKRTLRALEGVGYRQLAECAKKMARRDEKQMNNAAKLLQHLGKHFALDHESTVLLHDLRDRLAVKKTARARPSYVVA